jgi:hypothetical protein
MRDYIEAIIDVTETLTTLSAHRALPRRKCTTAGPDSNSVSSGMAVARALGRPDLLRAVQSAFVHGMSLMLLISAVMSVVLAVVAATVLRRPSTARHRARGSEQAVSDERPDGRPDERQSMYAGR